VKLPVSESSKGGERGNVTKFASFFSKQEPGSSLEW